MLRPILAAARPGSVNRIYGIAGVSTRQTALALLHDSQVATTIQDQLAAGFDGDYFNEECELRRGCQADPELNIVELLSWPPDAVASGQS